jgi:hypothetical protein
MIMSDFDLKEMWDDSDDLAHAHYVSIEKDLKMIINRKSNNVISQLKKNIFREWVYSISFTIVFLYLVRAFVIPGMPLSSSLFIGIGVLGMMGIPYFKMLRKIRTIPLSNTMVYLELYIEVLDEFKTIHLSPIFNIGLFLVLSVMYGLSLYSGDTDMPVNFPVLLLLIPIQYLFSVYFLERYMKQIYGVPKEELKAMLASLKAAL